MPCAFALFPSQFHACADATAEETRRGDYKGNKRVTVVTVAAAQRIASRPSVKNCTRMLSHEKSTPDSDLSLAGLGVIDRLKLSGHHCQNRIGPFGHDVGACSNTGASIWPTG